MSEQIKVLSEKEKARKRINVFHGSSSNWINMIKELIGNSHDVFSKETLNEIHIIVHNRNKIEYIDSAQGIPVEGIASDDSPNYEAIFEKDFAGSRYDNEKDTVGQNGIFLYTLSMTCQDIEYFIARPNKNLYYIKYHKGDRIEDLKIIGKEEKTYSKIIFSLDEEVWDVPNFTFEEISNIAQAQASLGNIKITIEDKERNLIKEFYYTKGIESYFEESTKNKSIISDNIRIQKSLEYDFIKKSGMTYTNGTSDPETVTKYTDKINIDFIFNYSNDNNEDFQKEFLNTADLLLHGTIQEGIFNGLKNCIDKWLTKNNKYDKNEKHISIDDISTGLNYICNMSSLYVEYDNQIKQKTSVKRYKTIVKDIIEEYMEIFFIENSLMSEKICNQVLVNSRARTKADKARQDIKKKLQGENKNPFGKIAGVKHCDFKHSKLEERILIITEGISANSTVENAIDSRIMGCMGLRGRFINSLKTTIANVLENEPALRLIKALGCGIEIPYEERKKYKDIQTYNPDNLNYGTLGVLVDADAWGSSIFLGILTFMWKFMPTFLKENRVYLVKSPRYEFILTKTEESVFAYNEEEKEQIIQKLDSQNIKYMLGIKKGIGEFDKLIFNKYVLSDEARKKTFVQVTYDKLNEAIINDKFEMFMGEIVEPRKDFIEQNIVNVDLNNMD